MITGKRHGSHFTVFIINFTTDVVLLSLLLTLNQFHTLFWYFRCWFWTIKCRLSYVSIKNDFTLKNWLSDDIISAVYIIQYFWKTVDHVFRPIQALMPFRWGEGRVEPPTKLFSKREGLDRISIFRGGLLGMRGWPFSGGCNFHIKHKLNSEIFNDKKCF